MKPGPTLSWFSCMSSDKTIRSFYTSVLHLKNENITSPFSPSEAKVKINLQKAPQPWNLKLLRRTGQKDKTRLKRSWRTDMTQEWGSGWRFLHCNANWHHFGTCKSVTRAGCGGFCWLSLLWMESTPLLMLLPAEDTTSLPSGARYSRYSS